MTKTNDRDYKSYLFIYLIAALISLSGGREHLNLFLWVTLEYFYINT